MQHASAAQMAGIPLNQYLQTAQGKSLIQSRRLFAYEGHVWQGHGRTAIKIAIPQITQTAGLIDQVLDIDGSLPRVHQHIRARDARRRAQRAETEKKREAIRLRDRESQLRVMQMEKELGMLTGDNGHDLTEKDGDKVLIGVGDETEGLAALKDPNDPSEYRLPVGTHEATTEVPTGVKSLEDVERRVMSAKAVERGRQLDQLRDEPSPGGMLYEPPLDEPSLTSSVEQKIDGLVECVGQLTDSLRQLVALQAAPDIQADTTPAPETTTAAHTGDPLLTGDADPAPGQCDICGKNPPPGKPDPEKWLTFHKRGAHRRR